MVLERPLQLLLCCADTEVVQNNVALSVVELRRFNDLLLRILDQLRVFGVFVRGRGGGLVVGIVVEVSNKGLDTLLS